MTPNHTLERLPVVIEDGGMPATLSPIYQTLGQTVWEPEPEAQSIPLSHYLWVLRRHRWKIVAFILLCAAATLIVSQRLTPVFESTVTVEDRKSTRLNSSHEWIC